MKTFVSALFAALLFATFQFAQSNSGVVEGRIVHIGTTNPVANAFVSLTPITGAQLSPAAAAALAQQIEQIRRNSGIQGRAIQEIAPVVAGAQGTAGVATNQPIVVLSDASGRFSFSNVAPGRYSVRGEREGYMAPRINETYQTGFVKTITVERGQKHEALEMTLIPPGILTGRVSDPQGQPVAGAVVQAYRLILNLAGETWFAGRSVQTDASGAFSLPNVAPGGLYLSVTPRPGGSWERTFYGDVITPENATRINVLTGGEVVGLDVKLQARTGPFYKISGTLTNPVAPTVAVNNFRLVNRQVSLLPGPPAVQNAIPLTARPNGEFEIRDVRPGSYDLIATYPDPTIRQQLFAKAAVEIRNGDVSGIALTISPGIMLNGELQIRGAQASTIAAQSVSLALQSSGAIPATATIPFDAAGKFSRANLPEERFRVQVNGIPPTSYVADVRAGDASVYDTGLDLNSKTGVLQVIVNSDGQTLKGTVLTAGKQPAVAATVVLVPPQSQRQNLARFKPAITDDSGRFTITGVAPGPYTIYAWGGIYPNSWLNAKALAKFDGRGRAITVTTTTPAELQLEAIPEEN